MKRLLLALFFFLWGTCAPHAAAQTGLRPVQNRLLGSIDETELITLKGNVHPLARRQFDRGAAPGSMPTGRIRMVLERSNAQQQELTQYLSDLQNPGTPAPNGDRGVWVGGSVQKGGTARPRDWSLGLWGILGLDDEICGAADEAGSTLF